MFEGQEEVSPFQRLLPGFEYPVLLCINIQIGWWSSTIFIMVQLELVSSLLFPYLCSYFGVVFHYTSPGSFFCPVNLPIASSNAAHFDVFSTTFLLYVLIEYLNYILAFLYEINIFDKYVKNIFILCERKLTIELGYSMKHFTKLCIIY